MYCFANPRHRFVICVDAKCGSTSVKNWFAETVPRPPAFLDIATYLIPQTAVKKLDDYRSLFVVRDPLQRLVSFYGQFVVKEPWHWCYADNAGDRSLADYTFAEFIDLIAMLVDQNQTLQHHLQPQTRYLSGIPIDMVVRLEDLDARTDEINQFLGVDASFERLNALQYQSSETEFSCDLRPAVLRSNGVGHWSSFYNDELRRLVREIYADDIAYYEAHPWQRDQGT
ncbi:MAG: sulfotransferase family protein [bacterium]|nr:sulfotransferase family protein [bacterium]